MWVELVKIGDFRQMTRYMLKTVKDRRMGAPRKGQGGSRDPLDFDIKFFPYIVAPRVEIQMQGLNLPAPLDIK